MNYACSSHRKRWLFKAEELVRSDCVHCCSSPHIAMLLQEELRKANRTRSIEAIRQAKEQLEKAASDNSKPTGKLRPLRLEDEATLCKYYQTRMQAVCRGFGFPAKVAAAAVLLFKRFYLSCSTLDHDPKHIMLTCVYLACKVEEAYISVGSFCGTLSQDTQAVLRAELTVLQGVKFDLVTHPPQRALDGMFQDIADCQARSDGLDAPLQAASTELLAQARRSAHAAADVLMLTDAPLLYHPGTLALAALRSGLRKVQIPSAGYVARVLLQAAERGSGLGAAEADIALTAIDKLGAAGAQPVEEKEVIRIDRKRQACHNLLLDPESDMFKRRDAEQKRQQDASQQRKAKVRREKDLAAEADLLGMEQPFKKQRVA